MNTRLAPLPHALCLLAASLVGWSAHAQGIEPRRYISSQGVEMLMSRSSPHRAGASADTATAPSTTVADAPVAGTAAPGQRSATTTAAGPAFATVPAAVALRNETRIPPARQAVRDEERERVLHMEMLNEGSQLEIKRKALRSPRAEIDLDAAQRAKLTTDVQRHEENIRALVRELALLRPARAAAP